MRYKIYSVTNLYWYLNISVICFSASYEFMWYHNNFLFVFSHKFIIRDIRVPLLFALHSVTNLYLIWVPLQHWVTNFNVLVTAHTFKKKKIKKSVLSLDSKFDFCALTFLGNPTGWKTFLSRSIWRRHWCTVTQPKPLWVLLVTQRHQGEC